DGVLKGAQQRGQQRRIQSGWQATGRSHRRRGGFFASVGSSAQVLVKAVRLPKNVAPGIQSMRPDKYGIRRTLTRMAVPRFMRFERPGTRWTQFLQNG